MLQMILAKQEQILQMYGMSNPLVNLKQYRETLAKFINASGYKDDAQFLNEIDDAKMQQVMQADAQQDKTPPEVQASQAIAKAEIQKAQMKAQTDAQKNQLEMQKLQMKVQMEQKELELARQQNELEAEKDLANLMAEKMQFEAEMKLQKAEFMLKERNSHSDMADKDMKNMIQAVDKMAKING